MPDRNSGPRTISALVLLRPLILITIAALGTATSACAGSRSGTIDPPSVFSPAGPTAASILNLGWLLFALGGAVYGAVIALLFYALFRRRAHPQPDQSAGVSPVVAGGIVAPAIILSIVFIFTLLTLRSTPTAAQQPGLVVEVIGHQFWWEVRYPDHDAVTANEIHIPVGQPVEFRLTTNDVIHSFWVPELHGKLDLLPGKVNTLVIEASESGTFRGVCGEYCGIQHAKMHFVVVAEPADQFEAWLRRQAEPAPEPADFQTRRGQQIFLGSSCVYCHMIKGTNASGRLGPDLTHIASRQTLGAGVVPNNRGNLAGWIIDPQGIKPGNKMPGMNLSGEELQALLDYLATLD